MLKTVNGTGICERVIDGKHYFVTDRSNELGVLVFIGKFDDVDEEALFVEFSAYYNMFVSFCINDNFEGNIVQVLSALEKDDLQYNDLAEVFNENNWLGHVRSEPTEVFLCTINLAGIIDDLSN